MNMATPCRRPRRVAAALGLAAVAGLALGLACETDDDRCGPREAVVDRVIDGDTVVLTTGERVRYLGIDTPEITGGKDECYGAEAAGLNRQLVDGKRISLEYDVECEDRYGRLLAWIEVEGRDVNGLLVERGLACVLIIPPNGQDRREDLEHLEARARAGLVGMWGSCEEVSCD